MDTYAYHRVNISRDGIIGCPEEGTVKCTSRLEFLEKLNAWNRNQPGRWQYYAYCTHPEETHHAAPV